MTGLKNGFFSFLLVLLLMPIGHALMVLNEQLLHTDKYLGAIVIGLLGVGLLVWGIKKITTQLLLPLWVFWVEYWCGPDGLSSRLCGWPKKTMFQPTW
ncbi:MAG: hypothetical protein UZ06_CHB003000166 [Chlorobi bacterium OLB6]|nr:MAG: hypothetical protein UZ06_CHB003000166 [Chlorobi bacterium OLB6]